MDKIKDISVGEFFAKNKAFLGFDTPKKALLMAVKEAVDNGLDATEEAGLLPEIKVFINESDEDGVYSLIVQDNGPGLDREDIPKVFGKLLCGSRFHATKQTRGQQGQGISGACLYGYSTTGEPAEIISRKEGEQGVYMKVRLNTKTNQPIIEHEEVLEDIDFEHGTRLGITLEGRLTTGRWSIREYLMQTALANPHASISYSSPDEELNLPRVTKTLPDLPLPAAPHPSGLKIGDFINLLETSQGTIYNFLRHELSGVSRNSAQDVLEESGISQRAGADEVTKAQAKKLLSLLQDKRLPLPDNSCISPIGEEGLMQVLESKFPGDFYCVESRDGMLKGFPFHVECGLVYHEEVQGGLYRMANRIPLLYKAGSCVCTLQAKDVDWSSYYLKQDTGCLPEHVTLLVHVASPHIPYDSEAKEAIGSFDALARAIRLTLQSCGRKVKKFLHQKRKAALEAKKRERRKKFAPYLANSLGNILGLSNDEKESLHDKIEKLVQ
jgi:DNA topoisomerase-6 subunit B